jgi:hypothetical protein
MFLICLWTHPASFSLVAGLVYSEPICFSSCVYPVIYMSLCHTQLLIILSYVTTYWFFPYIVMPISRYCPRIYLNEHRKCTKSSLRTANVSSLIWSVTSHIAIRNVTAEQMECKIMWFIIYGNLNTVYWCTRTYKLVIVHTLIYRFCPSKSCCTSPDF